MKFSNRCSWLKFKPEDPNGTLNPKMRGRYRTSTAFTTTTRPGRMILPYAHRPSLTICLFTHLGFMYVCRQACMYYVRANEYLMCVCVCLFGVFFTSTKDKQQSQDISVSSYIHKYLHTYMHTCIRAYTNAHMAPIHPSIHPSIYPSSHHPSIPSSIYASMHPCLHAFMHPCMRTYRHAYIHTYIFTYLLHKQTGTQMYPSISTLLEELWICHPAEA